MSLFRDYTCRTCGSTADVEERYSLGVYAMLACTKCWEASGFRKDGPEGFDPLDAGETFEDADDPSALD